MVDGRQAQQKTNHNRQSQSRELDVGQQVMGQNLRQCVPWVAGVIVERLGPLTYLLQMDTGQLWKRQLDHLHVSDKPASECMEKTLDHRAMSGILQRVQNLLLL